MNSQAIINCEWGLDGINKLSGKTDIFIIVDVLSFSTCVDIAVLKGAMVYPFKWKDKTVTEYARKLGAVTASHDRKIINGYTLSPSSLLDIPDGAKLVLPSPNGSALSLATGKIITICGSLRNCGSVAQFAMVSGKNISFIAAGERWKDGSMRYAIEDLIGAGAIISFMNGELSQQSQIALNVFETFKDDLPGVIKDTVSGAELIERGFEKDVELACELNISKSVPLLQNGAFSQRTYGI